MLVIGGGPAGAAAAIEASRAGADVVVVDKASFPRDKCCGDGLTTGALRHLDQLGFDPRTVPSWRVVTDVIVRSPSGRARRFPLPGVEDGLGTFAAVARRTELDASLVELARKTGADVLERHDLTTIAQNGRTVTATVNGPSGPISITADAAIAADGMWSPTRKLLGVNADRYRGDWHAFRQYFQNVSGPASRELLVWFEPDLLPGYAWSFPVDERSANVGFGMIRRPGQSVQPMKDLWPRLLARPHIADALGPDATPEAAHRAWPIPTSLGRLPYGIGRVLFVGDALAAGDPMTGEGIGQALETGRLAVQSIMHRPDYTDPNAAAERYRKRLGQSMCHDHRMARGLSKVLAFRRGANASVALAGATDWTSRNFARWLFEDYPRAALFTPRRWRRQMFQRPGAFLNPSADQTRS